MHGKGFWSELDEVLGNIFRVAIEAVFIRRVDEKNRGDRQVKGQTIVGFIKRMEMAAVNTYFRKRMSMGRNIRVRKDADR